MPLCSDHGFDGIDVPVDVEKPVSWYQDRLSAHGLLAGGTALPVRVAEDRRLYEEDLGGLDRFAQHAAAIGITRFTKWLLPYSDTLPQADNFRLHADRLGRAAAILAEHGCRLGLEFLGPKTVRDGHQYSFIYTMHGMLDLCTAVGSNTGLLLNSWHWHTSLGTVQDLLTLTPDRLVYVHVNDAPADVGIDRQMDEDRRLPGDTGVIDLPRFMQALRDLGYDGPVTPEPLWDELADLPAEESARRAGVALQRVWP